jgi:hypothetical protein
MVIIGQGILQPIAALPVRKRSFLEDVHDSTEEWEIQVDSVPATIQHTASGREQLQKFPKEYISMEVGNSLPGNEKDRQVCPVDEYV